MKRILLFECFSYGHSVNSLLLFLHSEALRELCRKGGWKITLLVSGKVAEQIEAACAPHGPALVLKRFPTLHDISSWRSRFYACLYLIRVLRENRYDRVLVLEGDLHVLFAPLIRVFASRSDLLYLLFRPIMCYKELGYPIHLYKGARYYRPLLKNYIALLFYRMRFISGFLFEDENAVGWCRCRRIKAERLPTPGVFQAKRAKTASSLLRFTLYGVISEVKSASNIIQAWSMLPPKIKSTSKLCIKGRLLNRDTAAIRDRMSEIDDESIEFCDAFLDNEAVEDLLADSDIILLLYTPIHVGCSGVLVQAAATETPVLATNMGWIGYATRKYGLGQVVDELDPETIKNALTHCVEQGISCNKIAALQFSAGFDAASYGRAFVHIVMDGVS